MKKKFFSFFAIMFMLVCSTFILSACDLCIHSYSEWQVDVEGNCTTAEVKTRTCNKCDHKETQTSEVTGHKYSEFQYENAVRFRTCEVCDYTQSIDTVEILTDGNGTVDILYITEDNMYIKPVANPGYYFLKWEVAYGNRITESFAAIPVVTDTADSYKAIFTNDESLIHPITVDITVENDLDIDIEYLTYVNKAQQMFSYFVYPNENLALSFDKSTLSSDSVGVAGHTINHLPYGQRALPYSMARGYSSFTETGCELIGVTLKFMDIRNKVKLSIINADVYNSEVFFFYEPGTEALITTEYFSLLGEFEGWTDKDGNVISMDEEFTTAINEDTEIFLQENLDEIYNNIR